MYRITQLMSTPVASPCKSDRQSIGELSPRSPFPSFSCDFLDGESSFSCCSIDPLSGSHICRRSPRLLTNGYYIWTEDSLCCDNDGHVTLSPSRTSVVYKENLVRIFRKKRKIRHSLSPLFDLGASESWLHESIFDSDSSRREEKWLEGIRSLETYDCNQNGDDFDFSSLTDDWESGKLTAETAMGCSSSHTVPQPPRGTSQEVGHQSQWPASADFQDSPLAHSKSSSLRVVSFQAIVFAACLIISACARCFVGGILAGVLAGSVVITLTCFPKIDNLLRNASDDCLQAEYLEIVRLAIYLEPKIVLEGKEQLDN
ncbi:transmembrane protein 71 isoform X2 [Ochotona princeps]|uniref:transmembrane protein 71 isoform X2 n=1 Tax=Ochotona princeps TaxID=9978 RepID=UPI0027149797|nr:transmembrane protein 71 isoform X2 [Ochotona princeps]